MSRLIPIVIASALFLLPAAAQEFATRADAHISAFLKQGKFRGAVLVAKDGTPLLRKGYGLANAEWDIPNTPDTKFRLGSITKPFTAVAILQLAEAGKLKLDDPISKYYDGSPGSWEKITVHHLLTHTSGIPSYTSIPHFFRDKSRDPRTPVEIVKMTQDQPLEFAPGEKWKYNNTGYVLLGHIIEKVSGESYEAYLKKNVFDPLGMKDSGYDSFKAVIKKRAAGYTARGENADYLDMSLPFSAGSLYSTVDNLLIWDQALYAGKLLSKDSYAKMFTTYLQDYAYGWAVKPLFGHKQIGHGGGINGFNTQFMRFPDDKLTVIVLANINGPSADRISRDLAGIYFGEKIEPPQERSAITVAPEVLEAFVGKYELKPDFIITFTREGNQLFTQATGQPKFPAFAYAENKFFLKVVDAEIEFERDAEGKVTGMILRQGGAVIKGKRL